MHATALLKQLDLLCTDVGLPLGCTPEQLRSVLSQKREEQLVKKGAEARAPSSSEKEEMGGGISSRIGLYIGLPLVLGCFLAAARLAELGTAARCTNRKDVQSMCV